MLETDRTSKPRVLTVKEAAERLTVSKTVLYDMLREGLIPHRRIGTGRSVTIRIDVADVEAYWEKCRVTGPTPKPEPEVKSALRHFRPPATPPRQF